MKIEEIKELVEALGWRSIVSRNPLMISFLKDDDTRLNFYFTTGTLTIQVPTESYFQQRGIKTLLELETCLVKKNHHGK